MNQCVFSGNVVKDAETKTVGKGTVTNFSVAVHEKITSTNETKELTTYFDCEAWGPQSDKAANLKRGDIVLVGAVYRVQSWETDGQKRSRGVFRVVEVGSVVKTKKKATTTATAAAESPNDAAVPF